MRRFLIGAILGFALAAAILSPPLGLAGAWKASIGIEARNAVTSPQFGVAPPPTGHDPLQAPPPIDLGSFSPSEVFTNARFALNGVAMRDCKMGGINLVGPPEGASVLKAYLYWQWVTIDLPQPGIETIRFKQVFPEKIGGPVTGVEIATGPDPCWSGLTSTVTYRADVTSTVDPTGNGSGGGTYGVVLSGNPTGSTSYTDPWIEFTSGTCTGPAPPYLAGAALLVIYQSDCETNGTVCLYDTGLASTTFVATPGIIYDLTHPTTPETIAEARWAQIAADGQTGLGFGTQSGAANTTTLLNGQPIAGPFTLYNDSDWGGSGGKPLPQLFETSGHEVTDQIATLSTSTNLLAHETEGDGTDCLVPVANVLFFR